MNTLDCERVLCLDPGPFETGWMVLNRSLELPIEHGIDSNEYVDNVLISRARTELKAEHLAIEHICNYGREVGQEVFDTAMWVGRFVRSFDGPFTLCFRPYIRMHLCHSMHAKQAQVNSVLKDRYGGKGIKKNPGKLYGVKDHIWSALAIGTYFSDQVDMGLVQGPIEGTLPPLYPIYDPRKKVMLKMSEQWIGGAS